MKPNPTFDELIKGKQKLLKDFDIKWDDSIRSRALMEMEARPTADPEIILDRICRGYIDRRLGII